MQGRFWLGSYAEFDIAKKEKERLQNDNPDNSYQIRRGSDDKGRLTFRLVERFKKNEAKVIQESKQKNKKKGKKKVEDLSWIRG